MDVFSFDQRYFFDRQPDCERWYAYLHPALNRDASDEFAHGYFRVSDGRYDEPPGDGRCFNEEQIREIEAILETRACEMDAKQFDAYKELPSHYKELSAKTNRYSDVFHRLRTKGCCDPNFSVAFEQLRDEQPAYRLTREFVTRILERANNVASQDRDKWLHERLMDSWVYDVEPCAEPSETFEAFYEKSVRGLMFPKPAERREGTEYQIYQVVGLPQIYLLSEEFEARIKSFNHYLDRGSAVVLLDLPSNCYLL
jgi:hypothetical protein